MDTRRTGRVALMAIHPKYAEAILTGEKLVEFRKRPPAPDIREILIYATSPIQRIIGRFTVERVESGTPDEIWAKFGRVGAISEHDFHRYYESSDRAIGLVVKDTQRLSTTVRPSDLTPAAAVPQSFSYLAAATTDRLWPNGSGPSRANEKGLVRC